MDSADSEKPVAYTVGSKLLSEALLIAWVPVAAYFLTFVYEQAYLQRFAIPTAFVEVDGNSICSFFLSVVQNWWVFVLLIAFLLQGFRPIITFGLWSYILLITVYLWSGALSGIWFSTSQLCVAAGIALLLVGDLALAWLNVEKSSAAFVLRLKGFRLFKPQMETATLDNEVGMMFLKLCGITLLAVYMSASLGAGKAIYGQYFTVSLSQPSLILVTMSGEKAVCGQYDVNTKMVSKSFVIVPLGDKEATAFSFQKIGPLKFDEP